jgi:hypothetical protein
VPGATLLKGSTGSIGAIRQTGYTSANYNTGSTSSIGLIGYTDDTGVGIASRYNKLDISL